MTKLIDSHAHLTGDELFPEVEAVLLRAKEAGIESILNINTDLKTLDRGLILSKQYPWIYQAAATHPHDVEKAGEDEFPIMADYARKGALKAIGEIGLDYHYSFAPKEIQKLFLRRYFHLALECGLPVIIHCREAFEDFFTILDAEYQVNGVHAPGVLHCFTGTLAEAEEVLRRGWYISLSGIVTFKKSLELQEVAKRVPLDRLLVETDAPFLAPQSHRGKRNEPAFVVETAKFIAGLKGIPFDLLAEATVSNTRRLFKL